MGSFQIVSLALVALVIVQAHALSFGQYSTQQLSGQQPAVYESVKGRMESLPASQQPTFEARPVMPVQQPAEYRYEAPVKGALPTYTQAPFYEAPVKGALPSYTQAPVYEPTKFQQPAQWRFEAPAKGGHYEYPQQVPFQSSPRLEAPAKGGHYEALQAPVQQPLRYEAPVKGHYESLQAPVQQPFRYGSPVMGHNEAAPVKGHYEPAPVSKSGQQFYEAPLKGSPMNYQFPSYQAPLRSFEAPVQQPSFRFEAPAKGFQQPTEQFNQVQLKPQQLETPVTQTSQSVGQSVQTPKV